MAKYSYATAVLAYLTYFAPSGVLAFHPSSHVSHVTSISSSQLSAVPTPFIISPIIRKFREEQAKKNMPLATDEEKASEAPGLRIGKDAWKFPPIFPFDDKMFLSKVDEESAPKPTAQANPMAALLQQQIAPGTNAAPALPEASEPVEKFDYKGFWTSEMADVETALDSRAANALTNHYSFYIKSGMSVLEFGAAENSYLPEDIELERHVGVSLSPTLMEKNPRLTERLTVDLNDVTEEIGVNSDELYALGSDQFDAIIMANTVEFLSNPREVYKSAYRLLKPGGIMMVSFSSSDAYEQFAKAQNKWWRMFNSDQHTWVTGSFFRFSAGEGWANLKGFDASPEGAKGVTETSGPLDKILGKSDKPKNMYIVQARKDAIDDVIDVENAEKSFSTKLWLTPVMESRDKELVAARLGAIYKSNVSNERKQALSDNIDTLPKIYECLIKMDQFAFPFGLQAELAANLVSDPSFVANDEQILALRQGLGLKKATPEFWSPVGKLTSKMSPDDKVNLLSYIVPRFGSGDPEQEAALQSFVTGFTPTFEVIESKCPDMSKSDVQLVGTELLASEILIPGRSTRKEFALWLEALSASDFEYILARRKKVKLDAKEAMTKFQDERKAEEERKQAEIKAYREQVARARKERTMVFDEKTGKMVEKEKK